MTREELIQGIDFATKAGDLELASRLSEQLKASPPAPIPTPSNAGRKTGEEGIWAGIKEVAGEAPRHIRETVATLATAPAKAVAGLSDIGPFLFKEGAKRFGLKTPEMGEPLTPAVDQLRDLLAGRKLSGPVTAALEGAGGGLLAKGPALANAAVGATSGAASELTAEKTQNPWLALAAGAGAGAGVGGAAKFAALGTMDPRRWHAAGRYNEALAGTNEQELNAMQRLQQEAAAKGVKLFPSQTSAQGAPGFRTLETEILRSKAPGAFNVQQQAFQQPLQAQEFVKRLLPPTRRDLTEEGVAANFQSAADKAAKARNTQGTAAVKPAYDQAFATTARMTEDDLRGMKQHIDAAISSVTTPEQSRKAFAKMQAFVQGKLQPIDDLVMAMERADNQKAALTKAIEEANKKLAGKPKDAKTWEDAIKKAQESISKIDQKLPAMQKKLEELRANAADPRELRTRYQDLETDLNKIGPGGARDYSDHEAGVVRSVLDRTYKEGYERREPMFELGRELTSSRHRKHIKDSNISLDPSRFDALEWAAKGQGEPGAFIDQTLKRPDAIVQTAKGSRVRQPDGTRVTEGADPSAARDVLAQALERQRQQAFKLSDTGELLQNAPARFAGEVAGTDRQKQELAKALRAVGVDPKPMMEGMKIAEAAGRPTVVHGARVPGTTIDPTDIGRGIYGGTLQQEQAKMTLLKSYINRLSDAQVADILSKPNSIELIRKIPGAKAMQPRALAAMILATAGQTPTE